MVIDCVGVKGGWRCIDKVTCSSLKVDKFAGRGGAPTLQKDERIVERGEVTGHAHRLEGMAEIWTQWGQMYVKAEKGARLVHEEHAAIDLEPGLYQVVRQREFDGENERYVRD